MSSPIPGYQLNRVVGRGGSGTVYHGTQLSVGREVAVKVLDQKAERNPKAVERMKHEATVAGKMKHPNVVVGIDAGEAGGSHYFVMEFVDGRSLKDLLQERGKIPEKEALGIALQIAQALDHVRHQGFVHRNVTPGNILVAKDGTAKLTDFGHAAKPHDAPPGVVGTPLYISPEQARGDRDIGGRADLYSLGATLYHLVCGRPPFLAETTQDVLHKHLHDPAPPPTQFAPELAPPTEMVILRLLEKEPSKRYRSATELIPDLQAARMAAPEAPKPAAARASASGPRKAVSERVYAPRRGRWAAPLVSVGAVLIAATALYFFRDALFPPEEPPAPAPPPHPVHPVARPPAEIEWEPLAGMITEDAAFEHSGEIEAGVRIYSDRYGGEYAERAAEALREYRGRLESHAWDLARPMLDAADTAMEGSDPMAALAAMEAFPEALLERSEAGGRIRERREEVRQGLQERAATLLQQAGGLEGEHRYAEALGVLAEAERIAPEAMQAGLRDMRARIQALLAASGSEALTQLRDEYLALDGEYKRAMMARDYRGAVDLVAGFVGRERTSQFARHLVFPFDVAGAVHAWDPAALADACLAAIPSAPPELQKDVLVDLSSAAECELVVRAVADRGPADPRTCPAADLVAAYRGTFADAAAFEADARAQARAGLVCFFSGDESVYAAAADHLHAAERLGFPGAERFLRTLDQIETERRGRDLLALFGEFRDAVEAQRWGPARDLWARLEPGLSHPMLQPVRETAAALHARLEAGMGQMTDLVDRFHAAVEELGDGRYAVTYDFHDPVQMEAWESVATLGGEELHGRFDASRRSGIESRVGGAAIAWRFPVRGDVTVEYTATFLDITNTAIDLYWHADSSSHYSFVLGLDIVTGREDPDNQVEATNGMPRNCILKYPVAVNPQDWPLDPFWRVWFSRMVGGRTGQATLRERETYTVRAERQGSTLRLSVGDAPVWEGQDGEYTEGRVLLYTASRIQVREIRIACTPVPE